MKKIILSLLSLVIPFWALTQNVGIGNTNPAYKADISGRMRIRGGADLNNSAGLWLGGTGTESQVNKAFIGIASDTTAGFFGNPGAGWAFSMDIRNGNTGIGQGVPLDKAGFTVNNKVGAVNAIFGSNVSGVSIESDFPGIGFNTYYNGGRKAIASGYGGYIGADPVSGGLQFYVTDNTYAAGTPVTLHTGIAIQSNGNTGIGVPNPEFKLDVGGRIRIRSQPGGFTAGLWLNNDANTASPAFIGMQSNNLVGLYGNNGAGFGLNMNISTGNVGIGVADAVYRLDVGERMRIRSTPGNTAGIWLNNSTNTVSPAFIGMRDDAEVGFYGSGNSSWAFTMNTNNGALNLNGNAGQAGQVLTSNGASAGAGWTSAGNIIKTGFAGLLSTTYQIEGADFKELTGSAYTVTLTAPSRVILYSKTATAASCFVDCETRWRLEIWLNGSVSRTYNIAGSDRAIFNNSLNLALTTGPDYFDLPAGTHNFTFFATNLFGKSFIHHQVTSMIISL